jgi:oxygen-independent coproporphyrinogen-3 oxidase
VRKCPYCDFNSHVAPHRGQGGIDQDRWRKALLRELEHAACEAPGRRVETIFFGGGTPSLLSPKQFELIFKAIRTNFILTDDIEITIEANPGTVSYEDLLALRKIGINRISYGVQSANTEELHMLERTHTFFDVIEAVSNARKAGFDNLNLDLIYGLPEQSLQTWQTTVKRILDLHPEHISAYALTLEHGTPFGRWSSRGLLPLPDADLAAEMYEWGSEIFEVNGYVQYEISNWAKDAEGRTSNVHSSTFDLRPLTPSFACKHNLQYWRGLPYLAFGAGAHGYANGCRYSNVLRIKTYIERLTNPDSRISNIEFPLSSATVNQHKQTIQDDMSEFMMTGLRLTREGVNDEDFQARFGKSMRDVYGIEIEELLKLGLIESLSPIRAERSGSKVEARGEGDVLRITQHGRLLGNQVFMRFV